MFTLILLVFSFVLCCIAIFVAPPTTPAPNWQRIIAAAWACYFLALILGDKLVSARIGN